MRYLLLAGCLWLILAVTGPEEARAQGNRPLVGRWVFVSDAPERAGYTLRETLSFRLGRPAEPGNQAQGHAGHAGEHGPQMMRTGTFEREVHLLDPSGRDQGIVLYQSGSYSQESDLGSNVLIVLVNQEFKADDLDRAVPERPQLEELMFPFSVDYLFSVDQDRMTLTNPQEENPAARVYTRNG